jgi:hypothetical protein
VPPDKVALTSIPHLRFVDGLGDVWKWDGTNWSQLGSLGVRADAAAIDIGATVIFFGGDGPSGHFNDLKQFDGAAWSTVTPT